MTNPADILYVNLPEKGITIKDFLKQTLTEIVNDGESFRGKDWLEESGMAEALVRAGLVEGAWSSTNGMEEINWKDLDRVLKAAVAAM